MEKTKWKRESKEGEEKGERVLKTAHMSMSLKETVIRKMSIPEEGDNTKFPEAESSLEPRAGLCGALLTCGREVIILNETTLMAYSALMAHRER